MPTSPKTRWGPPLYITKRKIQVITLDLSPAYRSDPNARDVRLNFIFVLSARDRVELIVINKKHPSRDTLANLPRSLPVCADAIAREDRQPVLHVYPVDGPHQILRQFRHGRVEVLERLL